MNDRVTNPPTADECDVSLGADGIEIADAFTGRVVLVIPHAQITDLMKRLTNAMGDSLTARVLGARDGGEPL